MKKIFVISAYFGYWDLTRSKTIFATESEEKAKSYCYKANKLMDMYKPYFEKLHDELMNDIYKLHNRRDDFCELVQRLDFVSGSFAYAEVELR